MKAFWKLNLTSEQVHEIMPKCDELMVFPLTCKANEPTVYKQVCKTIKYDIPGSKFHGLSGTIEAPKSMLQCVQQYFRTNMCIDENSPKRDLEATVFQKFYFIDPADEQKYKQLMQNDKLQDFCFAMHHCSRSPNALLESHRDFVTLACLKVYDDRVLIAFQSIDYPELVKDAVRGKIQNLHICFKQMKDHTEIFHFLYMDLCGNIPALVYNAMLDSRNDVLIHMKEDLEE